MLEPCSKLHLASKPVGIHIIISLQPDFHTDLASQVLINSEPCSTESTLAQLFGQLVATYPSTTILLDQTPSWCRWDTSSTTIIGEYQLFVLLVFLFIQQLLVKCLF
mmetsp:Transcript_35482/g.81008  ORF Transcript_35482/g.81008 Transcript_35482/m.81008 type:complete len:107 (+) Transcript_35482:199-519(+)